MLYCLAAFELNYVQTNGLGHQIVAYAEVKHSHLLMRINLKALSSNIPLGSASTLEAEFMADLEQKYRL